ncbi:AbrB/MazE/SpoVT family DNA-binding domain-containing protein [Alkalihalobacterium alkalinitrilicum]|uniref:AbrB/MazE/SpoVT family DNA-binding domain-containing protein n=1 Tax=Alkalihalobacterium alkalinitrilicum TaxID=427920 RepID=UPI000994D818|nr:AbrB/MazE/SpoVT family DNA-binding domain-containing protein [Alkalihalobacterium alkalinitrilicum]
MEDKPTSQFLGKVIEINGNGAVVIPKDFIDIAQIRGDKVEIFANDGGVTIRSIDQFCYFCDTNGSMSKIFFQGEDRNICQSCRSQLLQDVKTGEEAE